MSEHPKAPDDQPRAQDRQPRAQYGEYATPEAQQQARGFATGQPDAADSPAVPVAAPVQATVAQASPARAHPVDRVVTLVLLAFGLFVVLNGIPGYLAMPEVMQTVYDSLGAGTYPAAETAASLGVTALVLQCVIWIVTAIISTLAIRRGRLAWWIAVVGGAVAFITVMVIVSVALFADPGFIESVSRQALQ